MKLTLITILALAFSWLLCYGAMRTAQVIAKTQQQRDSDIKLECNQ